MAWLVPRLYNSASTANASHGGAGTAGSGEEGDLSAFMSEIANSTILALAGVVKESASGIVEDIRQRVVSSGSSVAAANGSPLTTVAGDAGVGTQWLRNLLGRSEWTLPCVNIKIVL